MSATSTSPSGSTARPTHGFEAALIGPDVPVGSVPAPRRSFPWVAVLIMGLLATGVLLAGLLVGGGRPAPVTPGLPAAGAFTGWGLPLAELVTRIAAVGTVGALLLGAVLSPSRGDTLDAGALRTVRTAAEDMSGHDHGELSVGVLIDATRFHVSGTVTPGQLVTVFNSGTEQVTITADDGSFDTVVRAGTITTFPAPAAPGRYPFSSTHAPSFQDVLTVQE